MSYLKALQKGISDSLVKEQVSLTEFDTPLPTLVDKGTLQYKHLQTTQYGSKNGTEILFGTTPPPQIKIKNPETGKLEEVTSSGGYTPKAYLQFFGRYKNGRPDGWCVSFDHNKNMTFRTYGAYGMDGLFYADRTEEHPTGLRERNSYEVEKVERFKRKQEWIKRKEEEKNDAVKKSKSKTKKKKKNKPLKDDRTGKIIQPKEEVSTEATKKIDITPDESKETPDESKDTTPTESKDDAPEESETAPTKSKMPTSREYKLSNKKYGPLIGRYHQGHRHGIWFLVDPNGDDVFVTRYENGKDVTDYYRRDNVWTYRGMTSYLRKWEDYNKLGYYTDFQRRAIKTLNRTVQQHKKETTD